MKKKSIKFNCLFFSYFFLYFIEFQWIFFSRVSRILIWTNWYFTLLHFLEFSFFSWLELRNVRLVYCVIFGNNHKSDSKLMREKTNTQTEKKTRNVVRFLGYQWWNLSSARVWHFVWIIILSHFQFCICIAFENRALEIVQILCCVIKRANTEEISYWGWKWEGGRITMAESLK